MDEMMLEWLFPLLKMTYEEMNIENTAKILLWCSLFIDAWKTLIHVFRLIKSWEDAIEALKQMILSPECYVKTWIPLELQSFATEK